MKKNVLGTILVLMVMAGFAQLIFAELPEKKFATTDGSRPGGLFVPGVMIGKTLYISGKGDYKPGEPYPVKVRNCLNEVRKTLQVMGMDYENIVTSFCYLEEPDRYAEFNEVYAEFFPKDPPARTTLGVPKVPGDSRIEITCIAYADLSEKKRIGTPPEGFPFSPGILAGNTLYISGKGDQLPDGKHPDTFEEQVRQAMKNVGSVLKEAGLNFENVVLSRVYIDNYDNYGIVNKVYSEFFEYGNEPARETVFVDWIPGGSHIEITCIATSDLSIRKVVRPKSMSFGPEEIAMTASPAVWAGNTLYISSISGFVPEEGITSVDLGTQTHQMAKNHIDILNEAGLRLEDIVSGNVYLRNINDYAPFNEIYKEYFTKGPGVRTCLMPNSGYEKNDIRVRASFIAAKTK
ncbi:MAG: RidA family protein [Candidatus Latescibacteria bacterium]|nr:RidA family protein [Candidatus Latescibacterota bacterium]